MSAAGRENRGATGQQAILPRGELGVSAPRELLVVRSEGCAFEPDGRPAGDTLLLRDETGTRRHQVPSRIPEGDVVATHDEEVAWGGVLNEHFGHFLTETVSRMWPLVAGRELEGLPVAFAVPRNLPGPAGIPVVREWLDAFGARLVELPEHGAVRFRRMRVPEPAVRLNTWIAPEIRDIHLQARRGLDVPSPPHGDAATSPLPRRDVLWLSRQGLAEMRQPHDEALLEWILGDSLTIVRPETLPLAEQVATLEGARAVAGVMGSAFHVLLLAREQPECLYLCPPWEKSAYPAQHALLEGSATFARALSAEWTRAARERGRMIFPFGYRLSIPAALRALRASVLPDLFENERIAAFAAAGPDRPESELDDAALAVVRDPYSSTARLRLGSLFETTALTRCALDQYRGAARMLGSAEAARRADRLS
jgi:glycosyl transferase family 61